MFSIRITQGHDLFAELDAHDCGGGSIEPCGKSASRRQGCRIDARDAEVQADLAPIRAEHFAAIQAAVQQKAASYRPKKRGSVGW
jgi:hypothetical protein